MPITANSFTDFHENAEKSVIFLQKNLPFPPGPHNCSPQQGLNAAFVASCFPSSPATRSGAQAPVFPRVPKPKFIQHPKAKKKTQKTKNATRKAHMRKTFFSNTYAHRLVVDCPTYHLPLTSYHVQTRKTLRT